MKTQRISLLAALILTCQFAFSQAIIKAGEGITDLKIGSTTDEVEWILGFRGLKLMSEGVPEVLKIQAEMLDIDFDYVYNYQHIMALPVSTVYFKNDKVVMIVVSSYPEYNEILCIGIRTQKGLNFWDTVKEMKKIYGKEPESLESDFNFYYYKDLGLSVSIDNNGIRTMSIF